MGSTSRKFTSLITLSVKSAGLFSFPGLGDRGLSFEFSLDSLLLLEIMLHEHDPAKAEAEFLALWGRPPSLEVETVLNDFDFHSRSYSLFSSRDSLLMFGEEYKIPIRDLTSQSRATRQVLQGIGIRLGLCFNHTRPRFGELFEKLENRGYLLPVVGGINWGHLRRANPFCPVFGYSRGTPIDRYYLNRFIAEIRDHVHGDVVEIGGKNDNKNKYGFFRASRYRGLDLAASAGVDVIGDAAQSQCLPAASLDTVVAFNVLEHTPRPWEVVANMQLWLREGGVACCMVPNAQRLHQAPEDYWRDRKSVV